MFRNTGYLYFFIFLVITSLIGNLFILFINFKAFIISSFLCIILITAIHIYVYLRNKKIAKLSMYLYKIINTGYSMDIRENGEGELSILKNEIYKVTVKLSEQAEELKKEKTHLSNALSDISHQLKTPLTSMFVMIDLLNNENLPADKRAEFTKNINSQLKRIEWLVSSLLKLSKLDAGKIVLKKKTINMKELISKSTEHLLIPIEIKQQELITECEDDIYIDGDFEWLSEALANILKNCIEHTNNGGFIKIEVEELSVYTQIIISDNGEGIEKSEIVHIFERFYKGKNSSPDSIGIGLAMAKNIISKQNGTIDVESEINKGTKFVIKMYKGII